MIFLVILCITYKFAEFDLYHRDMYLVTRFIILILRANFIRTGYSIY